jgi:segregation and condensation protein A
MKPGKPRAARSNGEAPEVTELHERPGADQEYRIELPAFEGPLDMLLHLIQKHELDILDIPIGFITEKYLEYLRLMQNLAIDVASEYLVMAATLAHIKSKMLLPAPPPGQDEDGDEEEGDPREDLIRRLLEYQKYKAAAADLDARGALGRDVFLRGAPVVESTGSAPLAEVGVYALLDAFSKILARTKVELTHEVSFDRMTITERIQQLSESLRERRRTRFEELVGDVKTRFDVVITFLALLEMAKLRMLRLYQADSQGDIHVELAADPEGDGAATAERVVAEDAAEPDGEYR